MLAGVLGLAACSTSSDAPPETPVAGTAGGNSVELVLRWESPAQPITRSLFVRAGTVVLAGEREAGRSGSDALAAFSLDAGELLWEHSLRSGDDAEAVPMQAPNLRIVAAEHGVFLSALSATAAPVDPIVGYTLATGERLFPADAEVAEQRTAEELVGANDDGLVTSIGVVRSPVTGVVTRLKGVEGSVLGTAGYIALAWSRSAGELTGYDLRTDAALWTMALEAQPNIVVLDDRRVIVAAPGTWQLVEVADGTTTPLDASGAVDELNTFSTCATSSYQSVPVGRFGTPVACDGNFVAVGRGGRIEVVDVDGGSSVAIAACDPAASPFALDDGLVVCSTGGAALSLRIIDAATGFVVGRVDDGGRAAPAGIVVAAGTVVLSGSDGLLAAFDLVR